MDDVISKLGRYHGVDNVSCDVFDVYDIDFTNPVHEFRDIPIYSFSVLGFLHRYLSSFDLVQSHSALYCLPEFRITCQMANGSVVVTCCGVFCPIPTDRKYQPRRRRYTR